MQSFGATDTGKMRMLNEDCYYHTVHAIGPLDNLFIVADGMGGHNAGEVASKLAVESMMAYIGNAAEDEPGRILAEAVRHANRTVHEKSQESAECQGMGTTLVACTVTGEGVVAANVGDSRLYAFTDRLRQVTVDHSIVEELVEAGIITREESWCHPDRHIITRSIGFAGEVAVDLFRLPAEAGTRLLLCSDGLTTMLTDEAVEAQLGKGCSLKELGRALIAEANEAGGQDNITLVLVELDGKREAV